tara:strand:+ start:392 stop:1273 length:882 start_codon:yes stop_codon:yes gene_type:complete
MELINFNKWENEKKELDLLLVDKIIFNNEKFIKENNNYYFFLSYPKLVFNSVEIDKKSPYNLYENGLDYSDILKYKIPDMIIYKIIFASNDNKYIICDYDKILNIIDINDDLINIFINFINICEKDYRKLDYIAYNIKRFVTFIEFYDSYKLIEYIDKILFYISTYNNIIKDFEMIILRINNKNNSTIEKVNNRIIIFKNNINNLTKNLEQTRHGTMQRISYLDSGTARILTIVATIFLPTSFIVALLSMPLNGVPLRYKKNGYYIFILILIVVFLILFAIFHKDFYNMLQKQ